MEIIIIKAKSKKIENIKIARKSMKQKIGSLNTSPKLTPVFLNIDIYTMSEFLI